ncbi:hypothetical protein [Sphingomonas sp. G-3-2-10]|uniref:hypothetical protein n=1 Tax=Sphingomonas sp. G-3-2-10 TaxID=2728838 RepID=UPI00146CBC85|nr:hypothetical protein [Sphingomonas sp. G-3-2-10]NML08327.1 hypothetical protein [Sphingomonas sp. G-3-2-10]
MSEVLKSRPIVAGGIVVATGIVSASLLSGAAPAPVPLTAFTAKVSGLAVIPYDAPQPGTERVVRRGDNIFSGRIGIDHGALLKSWLRVSVSGLDYYLGPSDPLLAAEAAGGDLPRGAKVYCHREELDRMKTAPSRLINNRWRYNLRTRLCLVDGEADGTFDHAFLIGTITPADWRMTPIDPVRYQPHREVDLGKGYELRIYYTNKNPNAGHRLMASLTMRDSLVDLAWIRVGGRKISQKTGFDTGKPYRFALGNTILSVTGPGEGGVKIRYDSNAGTQAFDYGLVNRYVGPITIYI